jgi:glutathione S-transferase
VAADAEQLRIERVIAAPRELVFRLWSKAEFLARWFAPRGAALEIHAFDFRVGGELRSTIRGADGSGCEAVSTYLEIVPPERIVYRIRASAKQEFPEESTVTVSFSEHGAGTLVTLQQTVPEALAKRTGAYPSWLQMLDKLGEECARPDGAVSRLELFYHPLASFCHKVLIGLYENDTPFVPRTVDLMDTAASAAFFALWPVGKMPVLRDGNTDRVIPETTIILEYLDRHYPGAERLIPLDHERGLAARLWDRFFDFYVQIPMQKIVTDRLHAEGERDPKGVSAARASLRTAYDVLEQRMKDRTWAGGDSFGLADCAAAPALFYAGVVEPFASSHVKVAAYFERLLARPSFARVLAEARPYFQYFPYAEALPARFR